MMVYLVFFNGYLENYGSETNILGVYSSEEKAKAAIENAAKKLPTTVESSFDDINPREIFPDIAEIIGVELDETEELEADYSSITGIALGGYIE